MKLFFPTFSNAIIFFQLIKQIIVAVSTKYEKQVYDSTNNFPLQLSVFAQTVFTCKKVE